MMHDLIQWSGSIALILDVCRVANMQLFTHAGRDLSISILRQSEHESEVIVNQAGELH